jgi:hypothetical protein
MEDSLSVEEAGHFRNLPDNRQHLRDEAGGLGRLLDEVAQSDALNQSEDQAKVRVTFKSIDNRNDFWVGQVAKDPRLVVEKKSLGFN